MKRILSPRTHGYLAEFSIFLVIVALIAGIVGCGGGGEEEEEEEFMIEDWYDLNNVRNKLGADYVWTLDNDLDSHTTGWNETASAIANEGKGWEPIGSEGNAFKGTFDGAGHTISDLNIYRPDKDNVGVFGYVLGGVIRNVKLVDVDVTGAENVGGVVGHNRGTLEYSSSTGIVQGTRYVGGLAGYTWGGTVHHSESWATVFSQSLDAGGLVGYNSLGGEILFSDYRGELVQGETEVGGLAGLNNGRVAWSHQASTACIVTGGGYIVGGVVGLNNGFVEQSSHVGTVVCANGKTGGLVGSNGLTGQVIDCLNGGNVNGNCRASGQLALNWGAVSRPLAADGTPDGFCVGGLVGENYGTVSNSDSTGNVIGVTDVGGLLGANWGNVTTCNSSGDVSGDFNVGRLVGYNYGTGTVSNSNSTSCVTGAIHCGPLVGRNEGRIRYNLTVSCTGSGSVTKPGEATFTYDEGEVINLVATPDPGYRFAEWTGDVGTIANIHDASTTITMQGNYEITASFEATVHSTYKLICDVPGVIVAGKETMIPVTLKTDELGALGYDGVQIHIKVYPRAGDVTIKLHSWSFSNELYSGPFDLPADYNQTIYPLVSCSKPGQYTFTFSLIEAPYGPMINNVMQSITVSVVAA